MHASGVRPELMFLVFLTGFNREWQTILFRRQWAGRKFCEGAGWTEGFVEIDHDATGSVGWIDVQVAAGWVGIFAARLV
jgi:hypothetical protein